MRRMLCYEYVPGHIFVADQIEHPGEPFQRGDVPLQERLLALGLKRDHERRARETRAHQEQMHDRQLAAQQHLRLAPVNLGLYPRVGRQRHEHLADIPGRAATRRDIPAHLPLRHLSAVLLNQALPDPPGGMTLLARRLPVRVQPAVDDRPERAELRRRTTLRRPLRRRDRRLQRLPDRPAMHPVALRQPPDRQALPRVIAPDLLKLLHSRQLLPALSPSAQ